MNVNTKPHTVSRFGRDLRSRPKRAPSPSGHGDAPLGAFQSNAAIVQRRLRDGFKHYFPTPFDFWGDLIGAACVFVLPAALLFWSLLQ
ncbi:hypothetical protein PhaeoP128_01362 [Phaeobacter gallaeciensis]|nr:hypothetical protein PhaeoP129_01362 [Phaeobacter gallaeciensis]ATF22108.1 hypothetical protein PhaeoP128_01362 [Phaeobacter gallaeciensis]